MQALDENKAREEMVEVGKLAYDRGYICGTEGNFSIRLNEQLILTTASGTCKGRLTPSSLLLTNLDGESCREDATIEKISSMDSLKPSTELKMHLAVYKARPDVRAIVHAHPLHAVAFSIAKKSLKLAITPESILNLGGLAQAPYATPSTQAIPKSIEPLLKENNTIILAHHGSLTFGSNLLDAFFRLETLEHHAKSLYLAQNIDCAHTLSKEQLRELFKISTIYGMSLPETTELENIIDSWTQIQEPGADPQTIAMRRKSEQ